MAARIHLKTGAWFEVGEYYEDIFKALQAPIVDGGRAYVEYTRLDGGFPKPKVMINLSQVEYVEQVR